MGKPFDSGQIVKSLQNGIRDDFLGATTTSPNVNSNWTVNLGAGMTANIDGSSNLVVTSGTTANQTTTITSAQTFSVPFRTLFLLKTDKKITNCDIYFEIINQSGDLIGYYATGTTAALQAQSILNGATNIQNNVNGATSITNNNAYIWGIDAYFDEMYFMYKNTSLGSITNNEGARSIWTNKIPDPTQQYNVRVRMVNGTTAPASSTTLTIDFISIQDISVVNAEIVGGRGGGLGASNVNAIPAYITGAAGYTQNVAFPSLQTITAYPYRTTNMDTTTSLGANGTYTGSARLTNSVATKFVALAASDQAGTFYIDYNPDGSTWYLGIASVALVAGDAKILEIRQLSYGTQYYRVRYVNGSTAQTKLAIFSEYISQ